MREEIRHSNGVEERLLRNMPCRTFDPLIYRDDWEAFRMLNSRRFEVLYEEDFRRNFAKQDAFMILARAAAHVVGVHPYHEVI